MMEYGELKRGSSSRRSGEVVFVSDRVPEGGSLPIELLRF